MIEWKGDRFEMEQAHIDELRENHIVNESDWKVFEEMYQNFPQAIHPQVKKSDLGLAIILWAFALSILLGLLYCGFIIFQLALYNIIMGVVMAVYWWRLRKVASSVIKKFLDDSRKKQFKAYFRRVKEQPCF